MEYSKLKKEELLEIVQNLLFENEDLKKSKELLVELQKKEKIHLNGIKVKDDKIKEQREQLEIFRNQNKGFEEQHNQVIKSIEDRTKEVIANYQRQVSDFKKEYEVLKSTLNKVLEVNEVLLELKGSQEKSLNKVINIFNEALFEEEGE